MNLQTGVANFEAVIDVLPGHFGRAIGIISEKKAKEMRDRQYNYLLITESTEENGNGVGTQG